MFKESTLTKHQGYSSQKFLIAESISKENLHITIWVRKTFDGGIRPGIIKHPELGEINYKYAIYPFGQDERQVKHIFNT